MSRSRPYRRLLAVVLAMLALLLVGSLSAQEEITDDQVNEIAKDVYCPVCENTPLDVCPTQACADWRELIRTQLSEGATREEVMEYFARQYGDGVLANPPRRGISLIVLWVLPILGVLLAAVLFARFMRNLRAPEATMQTAGTPPVTVSATVEQPARPEKPKPTPGTEAGLDDYIARVEQELGD